MSDKKETKVLSLKDRILKNSTIDLTSTLDKSTVFIKNDPIVTDVLMLNTALSGDIDGGLLSGLLQIAAPSKHFKTAFALLLIHFFLKKYPEGYVLFYDSEFGSPQKYFEGFKIPLDKIIHTPVTTVEELRTDITNQLNGFNKGDKILILLDSMGNLASAKEVKDAEEGSEKADMTRAKTIKSLFRIIGPKLSLKDIPMIAINHTYSTMEMYAKQVVSGGTGSIYNSDNIWIIGKQQDKDKEGLNGWNFIINIDKSRYVKEKAKIPITVTFDGGINKWSGLFDNALEGGFITRTKPGWYCKVNQETGEVDNSKSYREDDIIDNGKFWKEILAETNFKAWIKEKYALPTSNMLQDEEIV